MAPVSLPPTFTNSFWSQDYRSGLQALYAKLDQGIDENAEIVAFIRARAATEYSAAASLTNPSLTGPRGKGFGADDGASLLMAFRGLQGESVAQGEAHKAVAHELETLVADPFETWAQQHKDRILESKNVILEGWLSTFEHRVGEVARIKQDYYNKTRRADEIEDDAKFVQDIGTPAKPAPPSPAGSIRLPPTTESIANRLREQLGSKSVPSPTRGHSSDSNHTEQAGDSTTDSTPTKPKVDKGKGKEVDGSVVFSSPTMLSPTLAPIITLVEPPQAPLLLAGLSLPRATVSALLERASAEMPLRPVRFPILGEYPDCFTGEEFVLWLKEHVDGLGGSLERAEEAARDLTEGLNVLRRIGEFGNAFEDSQEAFYQFRPKAFTLHVDDSERAASPAPPSPVAANLLKRSGTLANYIAKTLSPNTANEPMYVKARAEADTAEHTYRIAVRKLDRERLSVEQKIEETLKLLQRWELDRLKAAKTVLLQYQGTLANFPTAFQSSLDRTTILLASYQPDSDIKALIERYRTGPFRPTAQVFESVRHDGTDVLFGLDLRKWPEDMKKDDIPPVVQALLDGLREAYTKLPSDLERRKTWIYDVPLASTHHLREALNSLPQNAPVPLTIFESYDAPTIASTLKLWLLELDPPLCMWEGWEDIRKIYPSVGADAVKDTVVDDLKTALSRLPKIHLLVLDAIISHVKILVDTTQVDEPKEVYITKLALSLGRSILRPRLETKMTIQDRHPTRLFVDLVQHYSDILPPTIERKKRDSDRPIPTRKRTALVDQRVKRSSFSGALPGISPQSPHSLLQAQLEKQRGPSRVSSPELAQRPQFAEMPWSPALVSPPVPAPAPAPAPAPVPVPPSPPAIEKPQSPPVPESPPASSRPAFADAPNSPPSAPPRFAAERPSPPLAPTPRAPMPSISSLERNASPAESPASSAPSPRPRQLDDFSTHSPSAKTEESAPASPLSAVPREEYLSNAPSGLHRSSSSEGSRVRGPRTAARGPRAPAGVSVSSIAARMNQAGDTNRASVSERPSSIIAANPADYAPKKKGGRMQAGRFSKNLNTRSMASGSEDETVGKHD
ncbi:hypothetical protein BOTBODRAFT_112050 [Botryobasidium botryosum FD-172 SS1]|uniref:Rho-GAP domain-containing protein n=1 Tax=Botryobasidium botryosum (strain FD-172 SS1) TaxID=930990 RepID=A0A067MNE0_BOTB1|nr:hypothetical protein BOTBODRAFT_112050 [Botryobasidium botryosum FD-172 SS1]